MIRRWLRFWRRLRVLFLLLLGLAAVGLVALGTSSPMPVSSSASTPVEAPALGGVHGKVAATLLPRGSTTRLTFVGTQGVVQEVLPAPDGQYRAVLEPGRYVVLVEVEGRFYSDSARRWRAVNVLAQTWVRLDIEDGRTLTEKQP